MVAASTCTINPWVASKWSPATAEWPACSNGTSAAPHARVPTTAPGRVRTVDRFNASSRATRLIITSARASGSCSPNRRNATDPATRDTGTPTESEVVSTARARELPAQTQAVRPAPRSARRPGRSNR